MSRLCCFLIVIAAVAVPLSLIAGPAVQTAVAQDASTAVVTPASGPAGSKVTGSGTNWQPGDDIQASWADNNSNLGGEVVVASNGTFTDPNLTIPSGATPGSHQILFTDLTGRYFVPATFDVTPPLTVTGVPTVGYYLPNGTAGPTTNVPGWHDTSAFVPGEPNEFTVAVNNSGATTVPATLTFAITGPASRSWAGGTAQIPPGTSGWYLPKTDIPNEAPQGTYTITVTVSQNGVSTSGHTNFTVTGQARTLGTVLAAGSGNPYNNTEGFGQCTYGADGLFDAFTKVLYPTSGRYLPNWGNADSWASEAKTKTNGWIVSSTPQLNSIVVFQPGVDGTDATVGHVAWVTNISGSTITVEEMNGTAGIDKYDYYSYSPDTGSGISYILVTDTTYNTWAQVPG